MILQMWMELSLTFIKNLMYVGGRIDGKRAMESIVANSIVLNACAVKPISYSGQSAEAACLRNPNGVS